MNEVYISIIIGLCYLYFFFESKIYIALWIFLYEVIKIGLLLTDVNKHYRIGVYLIYAALIFTGYFITMGSQMFSYKVLIEHTKILKIKKDEKKRNRIILVVFIIIIVCIVLEYFIKNFIGG